MRKGLLFGFVLIVSYLLTQPEQTAIAASGKIAFMAADERGNIDIYIIDEDGKNLRQLTFHDSRDSFPAWLPDGRNLAFVSNRDGAFSIYRMRINRTNLKRIADEGFSQFAVSPDGQWIAVEDGLGLALVDINGMNRKRLRWLGRPVGFTGMPAWSPDGQKIAFTVLIPRGLRDIYVIDITEENPVQLTKHPAQDMEPAWSPGGLRIAFSSSRADDVAGNLLSIYVMDADGANLTQLTNGGGPTWSPDGQRIAFHSTQDGKFGIFIMDADGGNIKLLVEGGGNPAWFGENLAVSSQGKRVMLWGRIKQGF